MSPGGKVLAGKIIAWTGAAVALVFTFLCVRGTYDHAAFDTWVALTALGAAAIAAGRSLHSRGLREIAEAKAATLGPHGAGPTVRPGHPVQPRTAGLRRAGVRRTGPTVAVAVGACVLAVGLGLMLWRTSGSSGGGHPADAVLRFSLPGLTAGPSDADEGSVDAADGSVPVRTLIGTWAGQVSQSDDEGDTSVVLTLDLHDGAIGDVVGSTSYDLGAVVCHGRLTLLGLSPGDERLSEHITSGPCVSDGSVHVATDVASEDGEAVRFGYSATKKDGTVQSVTGILDGVSR